MQQAARVSQASAFAVQEVAAKARIDLPDADVTRVARAAAQLSRGLLCVDLPGVAGALACLGRGWQSMPACADLTIAAA